MSSPSSPSRTLQLGAVVVPLILLMACQSSPTEAKSAAGSSLPSERDVILVSVMDFELSAEEVHHEAGPVSALPGPAGRIGSRLSGPSDPAARAHELVELMAESLVAEFNKQGVKARRQSAADPPSHEGWLIRGVFAEVQEGNRLRRAVVGLGQGATELTVVAAIDDLSQGPPKPWFEVAAESRSGDRVGGGATLAFGPWGAAARFVLAGQDLERNVKKTAAEIVEYTIHRLLDKP